MSKSTNVLFRCVACTAIVLVASERPASAGPVAQEVEQQGQVALEQTVEERLQDQEKRIQDLEQALQQAESAVMSGQAQGPPTAADEDKSEQEDRDRHEVLIGSDLTSEEFPGSWPMFGSDYRMKIGGYFKVDALSDFDGTGDKYQFLISQIPVDGTPEAARGGYYNMFARETRFNFDVRKTLPGDVPQRVFIEMDFFDESSFSPRLRHAYLVYGNLLVGQTWSTLTELRAIPYMIDFAYGDAIFGGRTTQVRWQQKAGEYWSWAVALEMLNDPGIDSQGIPGNATTKWPVLAARAAYDNGRTVLMAGAAFNELRWDGEGVGPDADETAYTFVLNGRQKFGDRDSATWNLSFGDGAAENISALAGSHANAALYPNGRLRTNESWNAALGFSHKFTDALTSNLTYAQAELLEDDNRPPDSIKGGWVAHVNLIWSVTDDMRTGIEYMWGERENTSGDTGNADRVQWTIQYFF